jgi:hypothetical protein
MLCICGKFWAAQREERGKGNNIDILKARLENIQAAAIGTTQVPAITIQLQRVW